MSFAVPSRRLASRCFFCCRKLPMHTRSSPIKSQTRHASDDSDTSNPVRDEWLRNNPEPTTSKPLNPMDPSNRPALGDLGSTSLFEEEDRRMQARREEVKAAAKSRLITIGGKERDPVRLARVLDVNPAARERYQRRKVIQLVRRGGRLSKEEYLRRTEREITVKSHEMKTSVKKLGMLARQIAGKPIEDAITQMRFSKKKVAGEVLKQLEAARDEAAVARGMGHGMLSSEEGEGKGTQIQLKNGKKMLVRNENNIYIDQAWVGRGAYGRQLEFRAQGRVNMMKPPYTSLTVKLKEEHTRIREHKEREEKRRKKLLNNVWTHLPDRPVQWQRQWYTF